LNVEKCMCWCLSIIEWKNARWNTEIRTLAVFERKILRKIYGPVKEKELRRIRRSDKLETIIKGENIVRFIKCQRIRWLGHVERMQDTAIPKKYVVRKAVYNKTKRKTKNEMAGWRVHGPEKYGCKRMERQSKELRGLEAYCRGGQGPTPGCSDIWRIFGPTKENPIWRIKTNEKLRR